MVQSTSMRSPPASDSIVRSVMTTPDADADASGVVSGFVFKLAPYLAFVPAFLVWSVIPLGGDFSGGRRGFVVLFGHITRLQLADPPIGVLFLLALSSISVYGIMLAGWASGSKYPLLGSVRASAQMVSYEAALGLSMAAVILASGTLSTSGIVVSQSTLRNWNVIATAFVPFVIFMIAGTAELNRPPFDLVVAAGNVVPLVAAGSEPQVVARLVAHLAEGGHLVVGFGLLTEKIFARTAP